MRFQGAGPLLQGPIQQAHVQAQKHARHTLDWVNQSIVYSYTLVYIIVCFPVLAA